MKYISIIFSIFLLISCSKEIKKDIKFDDTGISQSCIKIIDLMKLNPKEKFKTAEKSNDRRFLAFISNGMNVPGVDDEKLFIKSNEYYNLNVIVDIDDIKPDRNLDSCFEDGLELFEYMAEYNTYILENE
jgi:hypothetical protein